VDRTPYFMEGMEGMEGSMPCGSHSILHGGHGGYGGLNAIKKAYEKERTRRKRRWGWGFALGFCGPRS